MCRFASFVLTKEKVFWLQDSDSHSEIISRYQIHESGARYELPVASDFVATCRLPAAHAVERFLAALRRRGKARLALTVEILDAQGRAAVVFSGSYVAFIDQKAGQQG